MIKLFFFVIVVRSFFSNGLFIGCFRIFVVSFEKNEEIWFGVRTLELEKRRSLFEFFFRRIFLVTILGFILRLVCRSMLNLEIKKDFCFSLKR